MNSKILVLLLIIILSLSNCRNKNESTDKILNINKEINLNPKNANLYFERAKFFLEKKEFQKALKDFNNAIKLDSTNVKFYDGRSLLLSLLRSYKDVLLDEKRILLYRKNDPGILSQISKTYYYLSEPDSSIYYAELSRKYGNKDNYTNLFESLSQFDLRNYKTALLKINHFIENNNGNQYGMDPIKYRALLYSIIGDYRSALNDNLAVLKSNKDRLDTMALVQITSCYLMLGVPDSTRIYFEKIKNVEYFNYTFFNKSKIIKFKKDEVLKFIKQNNN